MTIISAEFLAPVKLGDLESGELYLPLESKYERFLGGQINSFEVAVALDGESPFQISERAEWVRPVGMLASSIRFEVDTDSAKPAVEVNDISGALVLARNGKFLIAHQGRAKYAVALQLMDGETNPQEPFVGFTSWRIVVGDPREKTILFEHGQP